MYKMEISILQEKKKFMCSWTTNGVQLKRSQAQQKNTARADDVVRCYLTFIYHEILTISIEFDETKRQRL